MRDSMINGSGALCLTYSGDAVFSMMENEDLGYAVPDEGSNLWFDCMVIPKSSTHTEAVETFINFLLEPEYATLNTKYIGYSTPNTKVMEMVDQSFLDNNAFNPADDVVERCTVYHDLGDFETKYAEAWQEVKWYTP
jgi:spermidine/putrescine transport system substrate-binding protein